MASVYTRLLQVDENVAYRAISMATDDYFEILYNIARDIYDSCISSYYASYTPTSYKRHGNISGFNLYDANSIMNSTDDLYISFDENNLLPYQGKNGYSVRAKVLNNVMSGLRGTGMRKSQIDWPMTWSTRYPNSHSGYRYWHSVGATMEDIFYDFIDNVLRDTKNLFEDCLEKYI